MYEVSYPFYLPFLKNNLPIEEFFESVQGFYQDFKNNFSF